MGIADRRAPALRSRFLSCDLIFRSRNKQRKTMTAARSKFSTTAQVAREQPFAKLLGKRGQRGCGRRRRKLGIKLMRIANK
jgi:hypothetical protein